MAVAYRSSSTGAYALRTDTSPTAPAGIVDGDVLLYVLALGDSAPPTPTPPSGFTAASGFPSTATDGSFTVKTYVWWKIAASETATEYTATHANTHSQVYLGCYSGAHQTTPLSPAPTINIGTGSTTTATGLTTPADGSLVVFVSQDWASSSNVLSAPSGSTPTFTKEYGAGLLLVADGVMTTAGATGNKTITNNSGSSPYAGLLISIQPPAGPTTVNYYLGTDIAVGGWTTSTGSGTLASMVDETVLDNTDYIKSALNPVSDLAEIKWLNVNTPSTNTNHTVSYVIKGDASTQVVVSLIAGDGSTVVKSWTHNPAPSTFTQYDQTLTTTEANSWATAGYPNSRLRIVAG